MRQNGKKLYFVMKVRSTNLYRPVKRDLNLCSSTQGERRQQSLLSCRNIPCKFLLQNTGSNDKCL